MSKAATMHQEVNLIGMTVDQAMPVMENIWMMPTLHI